MTYEVTYQKATELRSVLEECSELTGNYLLNYVQKGVSTGAYDPTTLVILGQLFTHCERAFDAAMRLANEMSGKS